MYKTQSIYSTINAEALVDYLLPLYNFNTSTNIELLQRGNNDTYSLLLSGKKYILRIYNSNKKKEDILFEIDVLLYLHQHIQSVAYPIVKNDGTYLTKVSAPEGSRLVIITEYAEGKEFNYIDESEAYIYGQNVGLLHEQSTKFTSEYIKELTLADLLYEPKEVINNHLTEYPEEKDFYTTLFAKLESIFLKMPSELSLSLCHCDLHGGNANYNSKEKRLVFYDFDFCAYTWNSYDIACFYWSCKIRKNGQVLWKNYVKGYSTVSKLSRQELIWSKYFIFLRDIWVMSLHIKNKVYFGKVYVDKNYIAKRISFIKKLLKELDTKQN